MNYANYFFLLDELVFGFVTTSVHFRTIRNLTNNTKTNQDAVLMQIFNSSDEFFIIIEFRNFSFLRMFTKTREIKKHKTYNHEKTSILTVHFSLSFHNPHKALIIRL